MTIFKVLSNPVMLFSWSKNVSLANAPALKRWLVSLQREWSCLRNLTWLTKQSHVGISQTSGDDTRKKLFFGNDTLKTPVSE